MSPESNLLLFPDEVNLLTK